MSARLQWGRDLSIAERLAQSGLGRARCRASMGPRSFDRGKGTLHAGRAAGREASMGPRSFDRGKANRPNRVRMPSNASMGPRSFDRGKDVLRGQLGVAVWGFNGAAIFRSRKVQALALPPLIHLTLQWGRDLSIAESQSSATLRRPELGHASMGPRSFDRGKERARSRLRTIRVGLQWGRDLSIAESTDSWTGATLQNKASMGPRFFDRGKLAIAVFGSVPNETGFNGAAIFRSRKGARPSRDRRD